VVRHVAVLHVGDLGRIEVVERFGLGAALAEVVGVEEKAAARMSRAAHEIADAGQGVQ
jgi:hypothetical protein